MRILILTTAIALLVAGVVFIWAMLSPERFAIATVWRRTLAGVFGIVFGIAGVIVLLLTFDYVDPGTGAAEKARMERYFRESTEEHLREQGEAFSRQVKDGYPVPSRGEDAAAPKP